MSYAARLRLTAALAATPLLAAGLVAQPASSLTPGQPLDQSAEQSSARVATAKPKVGTYEGSFGPKDSRTYFALDVVRKKGRFKVDRAVAFYLCGTATAGDPVFSTFGSAKLRKGRFSRSSIVSIKGSFSSRTKVVGTANPAPGILGCTGKPQKFTAKYVGKSVDRTGTYQGTDTTGAQVSFVVEGDGRVIDDFDVARKLQCGNTGYTSLFRFGRSPLTYAGTAGGTFVTEAPAATFTYSASVDAAGTVSGTYQVSAEGCDTGIVAFTAARTA